MRLPEVEDSRPSFRLWFYSMWCHQGKRLWSHMLHFWPARPAWGLQVFSPAMGQSLCCCHRSEQRGYMSCLLDSSAQSLYSKQPGKHLTNKKLLTHCQPLPIRHWSPKVCTSGRGQQAQPPSVVLQHVVPSGQATVSSQGTSLPGKKVI